MIYIAYFFSGAFIVNGLPHFLQGISGNPFQSPFASPPGVGESSPLVNVLWGTFNFAVGYALLSYAGLFQPGSNFATASWTVGGLSMAITLAIHFGKVRKA